MNLRSILFLVFLYFKVFNEVKIYLGLVRKKIKIFDWVQKSEFYKSSGWGQGSTDHLVRGPTGPNRSEIFKFCWSWSGPGFEIFSVLVRFGPGVLIFFRFWSGPVLGPGPIRSVRDQPVLVRGSLVLILNLDDEMLRIGIFDRNQIFFGFQSIHAEMAPILCDDLDFFVITISVSWFK